MPCCSGVCLTGLADLDQSEEGSHCGTRQPSPGPAAAPGCLAFNHVVDFHLLPVSPGWLFNSWPSSSVCKVEVAVTPIVLVGTDLLHLMIILSFCTCMSNMALVAQIKHKLSRGKLCGHLWKDSDLMWGLDRPLSSDLTCTCAEMWSCGQHH